MKTAPPNLVHISYLSGKKTFSASTRQLGIGTRLTGAGRFRRKPHIAENRKRAEPRERYSSLDHLLRSEINSVYRHLHDYQRRSHGPLTPHD